MPPSSALSRLRVQGLPWLAALEEASCAGSGEGLGLAAGSEVVRAVPGLAKRSEG